MLDIYHRYLQAKQESGDGQLIAREVVQSNSEVHTLDQAIRAWPARLPSKWSYPDHILVERCEYPQGEFYSPTIFTMRTTWLSRSVK